MRSNWISKDRMASHRRAAAFSLVEIMVVVAVIGLLATLAFFSLSHSRERSQNSAFVSSVRTFGDAFVVYSIENRGRYPADTTPGVLPAGMGDYLNAKKWAATTAVGGQWDWDKDQFGCTAGVSVYMPRAPDRQMKDIDSMIDDGDLSNGTFRQRAAGFIHVVEF